MSTRSGGLSLAGAKAIKDLEGEGQSVHIKDAMGELLYYTEDKSKKKLPVEIDVVGTYSPHYRKAQQHMRTRIMKHARRNDPDAERALEEAITLIARCCLSWRGVVYDDQVDEPEWIPFSFDNTKMVLTEMPWIVEQLDMAMSDHEGFIKGGSPD